MKSDIVLLWENRLKYKGVDFYRYWAKRIISAPKLFLVESRKWHLKSKGLVIGNYSIIECRVHNSNLHKLEIGDCSYISGAVELALHGKIKIGSYVVINSGVKLLTGSHDINDEKWRLKIADIVLEDYVWVATGAIILPGVTVGRGAIIGAGAVVRENVPEYAVCIGNPAKIVGTRRVKDFDFSPTKFVSYYSCWISSPSELKF